jgi:deoxyribonuclease-4
VQYFSDFSSSPRQWKPYDLALPQCHELKRLREKYDLTPVVIHTNYLVNLASTTPLFLKKSIEAFRGEVERALALCAEYLVLHPGSFRGADRKLDSFRRPQPSRLRPEISIWSKGVLPF